MWQASSLPTTNDDPSSRSQETSSSPPTRVTRAIGASDITEEGSAVRGILRKGTRAKVVGRCGRRGKLCELWEGSGASMSYPPLSRDSLPAPRSLSTRPQASCGRRPVEASKTYINPIYKKLSVVAI